METDTGTGMGTFEDARRVGNIGDVQAKSAWLRGAEALMANLMIDRGRVWACIRFPSEFEKGRPRAGILQPSWLRIRQAWQ